MERYLDRLIHDDTVLISVAKAVYASVGNAVYLETVWAISGGEHIYLRFQLFNSIVDDTAETVGAMFDKGTVEGKDIETLLSFKPEWEYPAHKRGWL